MSPSLRNCPPLWSYWAPELYYQDSNLYYACNDADFRYAGRQGVLIELVWDEHTQWPTFRYGTSTGLCIRGNSLELWQVEDGVHQVIKKQLLATDLPNATLQVRSYIGRLYEFGVLTKA